MCRGWVKGCGGGNSVFGVSWGCGSMVAVSGGLWLFLGLGLVAKRRGCFGF